MKNNMEEFRNLMILPKFCLVLFLLHAEKYIREKETAIEEMQKDWDNGLLDLYKKIP